MRLDLDIARFENGVRKLAQVTGKTLPVILDEQGRLFVRDCVRATPPFSPGKNWTEPLATQKTVGENASGGQARSIWQDIKELDLYRKVIVGKAGRAGASFRRMIQEGRTADAIELLSKFKIYVVGIVGAATPQVHKSARNNRGRIQNPRRHKRLVIDGNSIEKLAQRKISHVGLAKSGWAVAAKALKLGLPQWIKKHASAGIFQRGGTPEKPYIVVGNGVPFIQQSGAELGIMRWAMKNRLRNLPKQIERTLRAQLRASRAVTVK